MSLSSLRVWCLQPTNGLKDFSLAQGKVALVLLVAYLGNSYEPAYPRNDNHAPSVFWVVNAILMVAALATWTHKPPRRNDLDNTATAPRVVILGREQTEEWKGWMQWGFIFYHYYRVYYVYNEIRVFVSAYVWMTGFGNFLYFDKKADYSLERFVSMILRINYFPLLLSYFLTVPLELYYVVPLHTTGFILTMITCYLGYHLETKRGYSYWTSRVTAVTLSLLAHIVFYETSAVNVLLLFSKEYHFRFQADKYSAWMGMAFGLLWGKIGAYAQWAHESDERSKKASILQCTCGIFLIWMWYHFFGSIQDKYSYNPVHPYVFIFPVVGWLMIRNCTRYLTECHSTVLEFLGRNTLETYVLQFHLFMTHNVQYIPIIIPGSGPDGTAGAKFLNMVLCGSVFLTMAVWARKITVATQLSFVELVKNVRGTMGVPPEVGNVSKEEETVELTSRMESGMSDEGETK